MFKIKKIPRKMNQVISAFTEEFEAIKAHNEVVAADAAKLADVIIEDVCIKSANIRAHAEQRVAELAAQARVLEVEQLDIADNAVEEVEQANAAIVKFKEFFSVETSND